MTNCAVGSYFLKMWKVTRLRVFCWIGQKATGKCVHLLLFLCWLPDVISSRHCTALLVVKIHICCIITTARRERLRYICLYQTLVNRYLIVFHCTGSPCVPPIINAIMHRWARQITTPSTTCNTQYLHH